MITLQKDNILYKTHTAYDIETGEVLKGVFIPSERTHEYIITPVSKIEAYKKKKEARENLKCFNELVGGSFTFNLEESVVSLFNSNDFTEAEKVHVMYIGSFVNYNGFLMTKNNMPLTKKLLRRKIKINNSKRFYDFYKKLFYFELITEDAGKLKWNTGLCFKGSPKKSGTTSYKCFKTYDNTIQKLYETHEPKSLSIIFKLIPYLNKFHNVLCKSVEETEYDTCQPFNLSEIADLLGVNDASNLKKKLLRIRLGDEFVFSIRNTGTNTTVVMNPFLIWLSSYAPPNNLVGDFSIVKAKLLEAKNKDC
jgi:hypothetical protein